MNMWKKSLGFLLAFAFLSTAALADEGMWLPLYLKQLNEGSMKKMGMKLSAEDIYSINKSSIKDAIVSFGGFCTGEIVSAEGLVFTNHHCGYGSIAENSTEEKNYLRDGFWAKSKSEELPNKGLTASILVRMESVTEAVMKALEGVSDEGVRNMTIRRISDSLSKEATKGTHYTARVEDYFAGNEYYLLVYEVFKDVRLVGTPQKTIGKFGGETDNWMWPRHTGDFSVFRIYMGADGKPAEYSTNNVPYKPKHYLPISLKGVKENDFMMILGFPGSTDRYLTSYDLQLSSNKQNPVLIETFGKQLEIMKRTMSVNEEVNLKLASRYASMSNTHKYYVGQQLQLKNTDVIGIKQREEEKFRQWVNADPARKQKYGKLLSDIENTNKSLENLQPALGYYFYGLFRSQTFRSAFGWLPMYSTWKEGEKLSSTQQDSFINLAREQMAAYKKNNYAPIDKEILSSMLIMMYNGLDETQRPESLSNLVTSKKGMNAEEAIRSTVNDWYANSVVLDSTKAEKFLKKPKSKTLVNDPFMNFVVDMYGHYQGKLAKTYASSTKAQEEQHKQYVAALREMNKNQVFYPDANSTLRVTYGTVQPYYPRDAVFYDYFTTHHGILEKYNPNDPEFNSPKQEIDMMLKKQFGQYGVNDTLFINFIGTTDITGGNSGSPVLDGSGNLIGLAFDGNWESMIGDLYVDPALNRTIAVDIRYVLWVIDELAGAKNLMQELKIVK